MDKFMDKITINTLEQGNALLKTAIFTILQKKTYERLQQDILKEKSQKIALKLAEIIFKTQLYKIKPFLDDNYFGKLSKVHPLPLFPFAKAIAVDIDPIDLINQPYVMDFFDIKKSVIFSFIPYDILFDVFKNYVKLQSKFLKNFLRKIKNIKLYKKISATIFKMVAEQKKLKAEKENLEVFQILQIYFQFINWKINRQRGQIRFFLEVLKNYNEKCSLLST
jgi:hypothetical protein